MIKEKYITVPKNTEGVNDYQEGKEGTENMEEFVLTEEEFDALDRHKVFDIINDRCDLLIDIYESETVTAKQLKSVYKEISFMKGIWLNAVNKAIEYGTCVYLDF